MIKTIKVKKNLRLDELIKYVRDNGINSQAFVSDCGRASVYFDSEQKFSLGEYTFGELDIERTFTVEVEEEITEDTKFKWLVEASGERIWNQTNASISDVIDERTNEIRALINGKLELIYERNENV